MKGNLRKYAAWLELAGLATGAFSLEPLMHDNSIAYNEVQRKEIKTVAEYVENMPEWLSIKVYKRAGKLAVSDFKERFENKAYDIERYEKIAEMEGIPKGLFIGNTMAESSRQNQKSKKGAAGDFQFMPRTGRYMGLPVNNDIDGRFGPEAAYAAADYINHLGSMLGYCPEYVFAASNWGMGNIAGEIAEALIEKGIEHGTKQEVKNKLLRSRMPIEPLVPFPEIYYHLPKETKKHVVEILACALIYENPAKYGVSLNRASVKYDHYSLQEGDNLYKISRKLNVKPADLQSMNLHVRNWDFGKKPPRAKIRRVQQRG